MARNQSTRSTPSNCACFRLFFFPFIATIPFCHVVLYVSEVPRLGKFCGWVLCFFHNSFSHCALHVEQQLSSLFGISKYYIDSPLVYIAQLSRTVRANATLSCKLFISVFVMVTSIPSSSILSFSAESAASRINVSRKSE